MLQHIYIHAEAYINPNPLTLDYNITVVPLIESTKYQGPKTVVHQNHVQTHAQNMGGSAHQIFFAWALPRTPTVGVASPLVTPLLHPAQRTVRGASHGKNITHTQHSPTCCFLSTAGHKRAYSMGQFFNTHCFSTPRELLSAHRLLQCICNILQSVHLYQQHPFSLNHISNKVILNINVLYL